jgi:hypothetical protein
MGSIPGQGNRSGIHEEAFFTAEARPREQGVQMTYIRLAKLLLTLALLNSCAALSYPLTIYSVDGEVLKGEYSFTGQMKGTVKVTRIQDGEVLTGNFTSVDDTTFSTSYGRMFGSAYGTASGPGGMAVGREYGSATGSSRTRTTADRFHGMGVITGKDTVMQCFYMGSMNTNNGIGKCKSNKGKEYDLQF